MDVSEFTWIEKYRPKTIEECILPKHLKDTFQSFIKQGNLPNLILSGTSGVGKTTAAKAMLDELDCDYIVINGSLNGGIDTLRHEIQSFAQTLSLFKSGKKYVIIDEADYLNANSTQPALRNFMEEYSKNCGFIFTCNYKNRIIKELHSRSSIIEFKSTKDELPFLRAQFLKRIETILTTENVEFDKLAIAKFMQLHYPDMRRILNELQRYAASGPITSAILVNSMDSNFSALIKTLKAKQFKEMRLWISENEHVDFQTIMTQLYSRMESLVLPANHGRLVLLCSEYQQKSAFAMDQQINTAAFLTEIMMDIEFK